MRASASEITCPLILLHVPGFSQFYAPSTTRKSRSAAEPSPRFPCRRRPRAPVPNGLQFQEVVVVAAHLAGLSASAPVLQRPAAACRDPECKQEIKGIKSPLAGRRFHDLGHCAITKLAESQASDQTIVSIAGHVSREMLEHYSDIRMAGKRAALDSIATRLPDLPSGKSLVFEGDVHQNGNQMGRHQNAAAAKLL